MEYADRSYMVTVTFNVTARSESEAVELVQHELAAHANSPDTDLADYCVREVV